MSDFKVWQCRKRWPRMRPVISTMRVDHVSWMRAHASVGLEHDAADEFDKRIERAKAAKAGEEE